VQFYCINNKGKFGFSLDNSNNKFAYSILVNLCDDLQLWTKFDLFIINKLFIIFAHINIKAPQRVACNDSVRSEGVEFACNDSVKPKSVDPTCNDSA